MTVFVSTLSPLLEREGWGEDGLGRALRKLQLVTAGGDILQLSYITSVVTVPAADFFQVSKTKLPVSGLVFFIF